MNRRLSLNRIIVVKNDYNRPKNAKFFFPFFLALSLIMVCIMLRGVWPLLIDSALILLQTVPKQIDVDVLQRNLLEKIDGILAVHDFHVWQLTGDKIIASAHIRFLNLSEYMKVRKFTRYWCCSDYLQCRQKVSTHLLFYTVNDPFRG